MIRILHISDFHYRSKNDLDFKTIAKDLQKNISGEKIDFVVFSGDLVQEEKSSDIYETAYNVLLQPILSTLKLTNDRLLITPGNHDKKLNEEMNSITKSLSEINTVEDLESFINDPRQRTASMENFKVYHKFISELYGDDNCDPFFYKHIVDLDGKRIALISINSAWRSFDSAKDRGQLIFPSSIISEAFNGIEDCNCVFCSMHHNLSDFKDSFESEISDVIERKCNILFTGHYHKFAARGIANSDIGIIHTIAPASYNRGDRTSTYGYSIVELNEDEYEVNVIPYIYTDGEFAVKKTQNLRIPMSEEKKKIVDFNKTIKLRLSEGISKANDLFITGHSQSDGFDFLSMFTAPVIKDKSLQEILMSKRGSTGNKYSIKDIIELPNNILLFGNNKCGKTSLLWKIYLELLKTGCKDNVIPFILDCGEIRNDTPLNLKKKLQEFLQLNKKDTEARFENSTLLLLVDDIDPNKDKVLTLLQEELKSFSSYKIVATTEETLSGQLHSNFSIITDPTTTKRLYFHSLTSNEVHQLTLKWPNMPDAKKQKVEGAIRKIFIQMHIPFNYWTASLFLWLYEKTDESKIRNNFELVRLYVDELLGARELISSRRLAIDYNDLLSYLAALAKYILLNSYAVSYLEWTEFTEQYKKQKRKFTIETRTIQQLLIEKGIIVESNEKYTYRLKGLFEYFLAYRMSEDEEFRDAILADNNYYLSFGNEIELYAGFRKNDITTVQKVFDKTKQIFTPLQSDPLYDKVDDHLSEKTPEIKTGILISQKLFTELEKIDDKNDGYMPMNDCIPIASRVQEKKYYEKIETNSNNLEKALFILSRVFRNSDVCDSPDVGNQILDFILTGTCNLGFVLLDELLNSDQAQNEELRDALSFISGYIPVILQTTLYDSISQANLARVFEDKLKELSDNIDGNQYRYFLIAFILIDMDMSHYQYLIDDIRKKITLPILKFMCFNKCILQMLKNPDNKSLNQPYKQLALDFNTEYKDQRSCELYIERTLNSRATQEKMENISHAKDYE